MVIRWDEDVNKNKNKLYKQYKNTRNIEHELQYKQYRNKLNKLLFEAEKEHFETLLNENKSNLNKSWRVLKDVINKRKGSSPVHVQDSWLMEKQLQIKWKLQLVLVSIL